MADRYAISSAKELDYETAQGAAEHIVKICAESAFTPPEAIAIHAYKLHLVAQAMNTIADALKIKGGV